MSTNVRETALYKQLVASGVAEPQALKTATAMLSTGESDAETQAWLDDIRQQALGGRRTVELSRNDIMRGAPNETR